MTKWYVRRREDGSIASAHQEPQPGYADEPVDEQASELTPLLRPVKAPPVDFGSLAGEIKDYKPEAVLVIGFGESAGLIRALADAGVPIRH